MKLPRRRRPCGPRGLPAAGSGGGAAVGSGEVGGGGWWGRPPVSPYAGDDAGARQKMLLLHCELHEQCFWRTAEKGVHVSYRILIRIKSHQ